MLSAIAKKSSRRSNASLPFKATATNAEPDQNQHRLRVAAVGDKLRHAQQPLARRITPTPSRGRLMPGSYLERLVVAAFALAGAAAIAAREPSASASTRVEESCRLSTTNDDQDGRTASMTATSWPSVFSAPPRRASCRTSSRQRMSAGAYGTPSRAAASRGSVSQPMKSRTSLSALTAPLSCCPFHPQRQVPGFYGGVATSGWEGW